MIDVSVWVTKFESSCMHIEDPNKDCVNSTVVDVVALVGASKVVIDHCGACVSLCDPLTESK